MPGLWILRPTHAPPTSVGPVGLDGPIAIKAAGGFIYMVGSQTSGRVVKIDATTLVISTTSPAIDVGANITAMVLDNSQTPAAIFVATNASPGKIYKLSQVDLSVLGSLVLNAGDSSISRLAHDGTYLYVLCGTSPGKLVVVDGDPATPVRTGAIAFGVGENNPRALAANAGVVWAGASDNPGSVVRFTVSGGIPTRSTSRTLVGDSVRGLAYGNGTLYAATGSSLPRGTVYFYDLSPTDLTIGASFSVGDTQPVTDLFFDSLSLAPNRYLYGVGESGGGAAGYLYQIGTRLYNGKFRFARRFSMDSGDDTNRDTQIAFDGTYLYVPSYTTPGVAIKFEPKYMGLVVNHLSQEDVSWDRSPIQEFHQPIGADLPIVHTLGWGGRNGQLTHLVDPKSDWDYFYVQAREDEETIASCTPFAFLGDFGPVGWRKGFAVSVTALRPVYKEPPFTPYGTISFSYVEIGI